MTLEILGFIVMGFGVFLMLFGVIGIFQRKKDFYYRVLIASKIDTVGFMTLLFGLAIRHGISFFSGKVLLLVVIILVLNPLVAHIMVRSAYTSGFKLQNKEE